MLGRYSRHTATQPLDTGPAVGLAGELSVPALARHLMDELPRQFGLRFSATVYRYQIAAPWIIDVEVSGLPLADWDEPGHIDRLTDRIKYWISQYNRGREGATRFCGPNIIILREYERHSTTPGRVSVRRYHLTRPVTGLLARLRATVRQVLARWGI